MAEFDEGSTVAELPRGQCTIGPWDNPMPWKFRERAPSRVDQCVKMSHAPWVADALSRKEVELVRIAVHAARRDLSASGTHRHIRGALEAGATREEILMIFKIASLLSIHTCRPGAPTQSDEANAAGMKSRPTAAATPVCDKMKAAGQWNTEWDAFFELDPTWTETIITAALPVDASGVLAPKLAELLSIAVDVSITHMYAPGTRRHIQSALKLGATMAEIMEVLKICVAQGLESSNLGAPILADELERLAKEA